MLYDAGVGIGTSLDVARTAQELSDLAVPRFADFATVDLFESVLAGGHPDAAAALRRTARTGIAEDAPLYPRDQQIHFVESSPQGRSLATGRAVLEPRLDEAPGWQAQDKERSAQVVEYGIHSLITVPLRAARWSWAWSASGGRASRSRSTRRSWRWRRSWWRGPRCPSTTPAATRASTAWR